jgi:16S rRNA (uracil1498-N3)-methyltransferase
MIRLFVTADLAAGLHLTLDRDQAHYLVHVMRLAVGGEVALFNGRDGEWRARLVGAKGRAATLEAIDRTRPQTTPPDVELISTLIRRARLETVAEKAAELGVRRVRLAVSARCNLRQIQTERLRSIAVEAAEQTGRLDVPDIDEVRPLADILAAWPSGRRLIFCDEAGEAPPLGEALEDASLAGAPCAILIGPEGGFSAEERAAIRAVDGVMPVSLGPRILRADTAAIAALALWQSRRGDWAGG